MRPLLQHPSSGALQLSLSIVPTDSPTIGGCEVFKAPPDQSVAFISKAFSEQPNQSSPQPHESTPSLLAESLRFANLDRFSSSGSSDDDESEEPVSGESPTTDDDDFALRALAFAKMRAASHGMGAAMSAFATSLLSDDSGDEEEEVSSRQIHSVAMSVISKISNAPLSLDRHISQSSANAYEKFELTSTQKDECDMVRAFIKRWAENTKLVSTHWQGTRPLPYKDISAPTAQYLRLYKVEQAIRNVSSHLNIAPPLEVDLPEPRLSSDPVHVGLARCVERGNILPPFSVNYSPEQRLEDMRSELNMKTANQNKKVQTVEVRLRAGAKRAAGKQKEAHQTPREKWVHGASKLSLSRIILEAAQDTSA